MAELVPEENPEDMIGDTAALLQRRAQYLGDVSAMGPPPTAIAVWNRASVSLGNKLCVCALASEAREMEVSKPFGAQRILNGFQTLNRIIHTVVLWFCLYLDVNCAKGTHSRNSEILEKDILKRLNLSFCFSRQGF